MTIGGPTCPLIGTTLGTLGASFDFYQLFAQHRAQLIASLLGEPRRLNVLTQGIVDQRLVVAAMRFANPIAKGIGDFAAESDCDA